MRFLSADGSDRRDCGMADLTLILRVSSLPNLIVRYVENSELFTPKRDNCQGKSLLVAWLIVDSRSCL